MFWVGVLPRHPFFRLEVTNQYQPTNVGIEMEPLRI
jgi:hypothetical protein